MKFIKKNPSELNLKFSNRYNKNSLKKLSFNKSDISSSLSYGVIGVKILESCKLQHYQFESLRKMFLPYTKGLSKV